MVATLVTYYMLNINFLSASGKFLSAPVRNIGKVLRNFA